MTQTATPEDTAQRFDELRRQGEEQLAQLRQLAGLSAGRSPEPLSDDRPPLGPA